MKLVVKQDDKIVNEFFFRDGPITIGRKSTNNIPLPDRVVSKTHAKIYNSEDGAWMLEDLRSANKTYLNDKIAYVAQISTGDKIRIGGYNIEVDLEAQLEPDKPEDTLNLEAALANPIHDIVVRKPDAGHAPAMRMPAKRLKEFTEAAEIMANTTTLDELLTALLEISLKQFEALNVWCALRETNEGPMICHCGKDRMGKSISLDDLSLKDKVVQSVERVQFIVMPRVKAQIESIQRIRSALIASITRPDGCYGVIYVDNAMIHEHYSLSDLDYLMILAIHASSQLKRILNIE
ncbi:MAG: FHA domain-containing protein [Planctomycetota bacterium]